MPCMGPSKENSYKQGAEFAQRIIDQLKSARGISSGEVYSPKGKEERAALEKALTETIQELFWLDDAETF